MEVSRRDVLGATGAVGLSSTAGCLGILTPSLPSCSGDQITDLSAPAKGPESAPVTVEVYSDFGCPHCATFADEAAPRISGLIEEGEVRYIHRDYPIPASGKSFPVANAARAVQDQGGTDSFWQFYALAFGHQGEFATAKLQEYAKQAGAANADIGRAVDDQPYCERIKADKSRGNDRGVSGTPTVFVGDEKLEGPSADSFESTVRNALK
jgi:protein-disulfide isomerase